jgi:DHA1 family bicyclomycin/chloramphenicol resistance-like MFS transporter
MSEAAQSKILRKPPILLLGLVSAIGPMSHSIFIPSFPSIESSLNVGLPQLQWTLTIYFIFFGLLQLLVGPTSDRIGRRPVFFVGLGVFVIASAVAALAPTIEVLVAARIFQALGAATTFVIPRAAVQDTYTGADVARAMAIVVMFMSAGPAVAPFLGGILETFLGWRSTFWFLAIFALILMIAAWRGFPETNQGARDQSPGVRETLKRYGFLLRSPRFLAYSLNLGFAAAIFFAFVTVAPGVLQGTYGLTPLMFSWAMVAFGLGFVVGGFISSRVTPTLGIDRMIGLASLVVLAAMVVLLLSGGSKSIWWILVPVFVYTVGTGALFPNAAAGGTGIDRSIAGAAMSFMGVFQFSVSALGTYVVGNLDNESILPFAMIGVLAACIILISASVLCLGRNRANLIAEIAK